MSSDEDPLCPSCRSSVLVRDADEQTVTCQDCGMTLEQDNGGYTMTFGPADLVGEHHSGEEWQQKAEALPVESDRTIDDADPYPAASPTPAADASEGDMDLDSGDERDEWAPSAPILSVFSALMLWWGAFYSLTESGAPVSDFLLFIVPGTLIIPRVRRYVLSRAQAATRRELDLTGRVPMLAIGTVYAFLVGAAMLLVIGAGANDPTSPAGTGFVTIAFVAILAVGIVLGRRVVR